MCYVLLDPPRRHGQSLQEYLDTTLELICARTKSSAAVAQGLRTTAGASQQKLWTSSEEPTDPAKKPGTT